MFAFHLRNNYLPVNLNKLGLSVEKARIYYEEKKL